MRNNGGDPYKNLNPSQGGGQVVRKYSTGGEDILDDETTFKNRTLRFTNNNFVGNTTTNGNFGNNQKRETSNNRLEGWASD